MTSRGQGRGRPRSGHDDSRELMCEVLEYDGPSPVLSATRSRRFRPFAMSHDERGVHVAAATEGDHPYRARRVAQPPSTGRDCWDHCAVGRLLPHDAGST